LYALAEERELLRETVRELAEAKIGPAAADVDARARFPQEAREALTAAGLQAVHVPEAYGGQGGDALAAVIVIEEVARVCASSSLIPAVNKLGTVPLLLSGSDDLKRRYLPPVARGDVLFSYALSEAGAVGRLRSRQHRGNHLDQPLDGGRVEEVQPDDLGRPAGHPGHLGDRDRRGVRRQDRVRPRDRRVELLEQARLQRRALGRRLDDQVAVR
jgi:hypothetical protein